jgi:hypothetical protein
LVLRISLLAKNLSPFLLLPASPYQFTNQSRYKLVILNSQKGITSSRVNRCGRLFSAEELMQSTVSHSASANAYFLTGPADKASSLVPTLMPLNWHTLKCAAVENAARGQLCIYRYLDLYFHLSFIFQNALGITTREVAAFLGRKHETETRLPVQIGHKPRLMRAQA